MNNNYIDGGVLKEFWKTAKNNGRDSTFGDS